MSNFNSADIAAFKDVWVFCEQREGKLMPTDFELISKGRDLANELGVNLCGLLLGGEGIESAAYNVPYAVVDGTNPTEVYEAMKTAMAHARAGKGPYVVEAKVYRYQGHYCGDPAVYRPKEYMENALANDGIEKLAKRLNALGVKDEELEEIKKAAKEEMDEAVKYADESPYPDPSEVTDDMYTADNERCVAR